MSSDTKKPGFFSRMFGSSRDAKKSPTKGTHPALQSHELTTTRDQHVQPPPPPPPSSSSSSSPPVKTKPDPFQSKRRVKQRRNVSRKRCRVSGGRGISIQLEKIDVSKPIEFPATPEVILAHHKKRPFLSKNEEWLVVELNEYECLVESLDILKVIANHSKFFEVEPDELWQEFFEYVEEIPSYDEIINYDVWQEFRDEKYPC